MDKPTNFTKIMSNMKPEHLAKLLCQSHRYCPTPEKKCDKNCEKCYIEWLQKPFIHIKKEENTKMSNGIIPYTPIFYKCDLGIVTDYSFRWGGIKRLCEKPISFWKQENEKQYEKCGCCGKPFTDNDFPYCNFFQQEDNAKFCIICKECAYKITPFVIEADGKKYKSKTYKKKG